MRHSLVPSRMRAIDTAAFPMQLHTLCLQDCCRGYEEVASWWACAGVQEVPPSSVQEREG